MKSKYKKLIGIFLFLLGVVFILNSFSGMTGYVVTDKIGKVGSSVLGLVFIVGGVVLFISGRLEYSVKEAIKLGVPKKEAEKIFEESNKKVDSGKWIELRKISVGVTKNPEFYPQATSLYRYWGPSKYNSLSNRALKELYESGKIGKTHELIRGSDKWKIGGSLTEGETVTMPPTGSNLLHRHWEIEQMYRYRKI